MVATTLWHFTGWQCYSFIAQLTLAPRAKIEKQSENKSRAKRRFEESGKGVSACVDDWIMLNGCMLAYATFSPSVLRAALENVSWWKPGTSVKWKIVHRNAFWNRGKCRWERSESVGQLVSSNKTICTQKKIITKTLRSVYIQILKYVFSGPFSNFDRH